MGTDRITRVDWERIFALALLERGAVNANTLRNRTLLPGLWSGGMMKCDRCGGPVNPLSGGLCPNCRYRNGGPLPESEDGPEEPDLVTLMIRVRRKGFRHYDN